MQFCFLLGKGRFLSDEGWAEVGTKERKQRCWLRRSREGDYCKCTGRSTSLDLYVLSKDLPGVPKRKQESCRRAQSSLNAAQSAIVRQPQLLHTSLIYFVLISSSLGRQKSEHFSPCLALQPATWRIVFLFHWGSSHTCTFLAKSAARYQSSQAHPGTLICLECNQMPS